MRERTRQFEIPVVNGRYSIERESGMVEHPLVYVPGTREETISYSPGCIKQVSDIVTPNFRKRIAAGEIITNPFRSEQVSETYVQGAFYSHTYGHKSNSWCNVHNKRHDTIHHVHGVYCPEPAYHMDEKLLVLDVQAIIDLAVMRAHANIDESEMMAWATVAESGKTVESMASIMRRAIGIFRGIRKLDLKALRKELKARELADRYMEARYAIRPLVYDVKGVLEALKKERRYHRRTYGGYAEGSAEDADTWTSGYHWLSAIDWKRTVKLEVSAIAGVLCDVDVTALSTWGTDHIAESLFELVPFSFIASWFCNVSDVVAAYAPDAGINQRASWVTVRTLCTKTLKADRLRSTASGDTYPIEISGGNHSARWEKLVLERFVSPPMNPIPRFNMNLDGFKLTDLSIILKKTLS